MNGLHRKNLGIVLILLGVSMWEIGPRVHMPFNLNLAIHMSLVLPGVYFYIRS